MARPLTRFVQRLELRNRLSSEERQALLDIDAERVEKLARHDLVRPGDVVDYACLVDEGIVARAEQFADGRRTTSALYLPGDMADLHSVAIPRAAWAISALTDCAIFKVPHDRLRAVFVDYPDIALAFWRDTVADASIFSKWVSVLSRHTAPRRLAHMLCEYGCRIAAIGGSRENLRLPLTQAQIAVLLGITEVHVQRTLRVLRQKGVIEIERRIIRILDLAELERLAEYDAGYLLLDPSGDFGPDQLTITKSANDMETSMHGRQDGRLGEGGAKERGQSLYENEDPALQKENRQAVKNQSTVKPEDYPDRGKAERS